MGFPTGRPKIEKEKKIITKIQSWLHEIKVLIYGSLYNRNEFYQAGAHTEKI